MKPSSVSTASPLEQGQEQHARLQISMSAYGKKPAQGMHTSGRMHALAGARISKAQNCIPWLRHVFPRPNTIGMCHSCLKLETRAITASQEVVEFLGQGRLHLDTTSTAISPVLTERPAQLKSSELFLRPLNLKMISLHPAIT